MAPVLPTECLDISGTVACSPWGPSNHINVTAVAAFYSTLTSDSNLAGKVPTKIQAATDWEHLVYFVTGRGPANADDKFCANSAKDVRYYRTFVCARDIFGLSAGCNVAPGTTIQRRDAVTPKSIYHANAYRLLEATLSAKQNLPMCPEVCGTFSTALKAASTAKSDVNAQCRPSSAASDKYKCKDLFAAAARNVPEQKQQQKKLSGGSRELGSHHKSGDKVRRQIIVAYDEEADGQIQAQAQTPAASKEEVNGNLLDALKKAPVVDDEPEDGKCCGLSPKPVEPAEGIEAAEGEKNAQPAKNGPKSHKDNHGHGSKVLGKQDKATSKNRDNSKNRNAEEKNHGDSKHSHPNAKKNDVENSCLQGVDDDESSCGFAGDVKKALNYCKSVNQTDACCKKITDSESHAKAVNALLNGLSNVDRELSEAELLDALKNEEIVKFREKHAGSRMDSQDSVATNGDATFTGLNGLSNYLKKSLTALGLPSDLQKDDGDHKAQKPIINPPNIPAANVVLEDEDGDDEDDGSDKPANNVQNRVNAAPSATTTATRGRGRTRTRTRTATRTRSGTATATATGRRGRAGRNRTRAARVGVTTQGAGNGSGGKSTWSAGSIALLTVGCLLVVVGVVAGTVLVVQRRNQRIKKPFTIKKFNHNPLGGGGGGGGGDPNMSSTAALLGASGASGAAMGGGAYGGAGTGVVTGDLRPRRVIYDYEPVQPDEILLTPGDLVEVSVEYDDGWATGKNLSTGRIGTFPVTCLDK
ncbi:hypothetical protein HDU96_009951 [Phlyctochytrium bullatum]|nr:hypothetical protein HDU96_009951 [Phlyctochytrium bullatum]